MLTDLGLIALVIAFFLSIYATVISLYGGWRKRLLWVNSARNAALLVFPFLTVSVIAVVYALYAFDFSLAYVYDVSSHEMSRSLRVTALWGATQNQHKSCSIC